MEKIAELLSEKELLIDPVTDSKVELARQLFVSLESQIMLADRKVQAVFGLNAFLVAALSLQSQQSLDIILKNGINLNIALDLLLKAFFLSCVCIATWAAVKALSPRVRQKRNNAPKIPSLFFFGDIRQKTLKDFSREFIGLTNEEAVKELLASSYSVSGILNIKYKMLARSTVFISLALLIWVLLQVNKFLG